VIWLVLYLAIAWTVALFALPRLWRWEKTEFPMTNAGRDEPRGETYFESAVIGVFWPIALLAWAWVKSVRWAYRRLSALAERTPVEAPK